MKVPQSTLTAPERKEGEKRADNKVQSSTNEKLNMSMENMRLYQNSHYPSTNSKAMTKFSTVFTLTSGLAAVLESRSGEENSEKSKKTFEVLLIVGIAVGLSAFSFLSIGVLLFNQQNGGSVLSTNGSTSLSTTTPATTLPPANKGLNLDSIEISKPLTQITSNRLRFHQSAFIHRGPKEGIGRGMYLVNKTQIYIIQDDDPLSLQHLVGKEEAGWLNNGADSQFSSIRGLAMTKDGSQIYISDEDNSAIRLYLADFNLVFDFASATLFPDSKAKYIPELLQPTVLELYFSSLFVKVKGALGKSSILQINIFDGRSQMLPDIPTSYTGHDITDMILRDWRLFACLNNEVWVLDSFLIDSQFLRDQTRDSLQIFPTWTRFISPSKDSLLVSDEIVSCKHLETSPDLNMLYVGNEIKGHPDSILAYNLSNSQPEVPLRFTTPTISNLLGFGVRAVGNAALLLTENALFSLSFQQDEQFQARCVQCSEAPPGEGYLPYNATSTSQEWVIQSQSDCYRHRSYVASLIDNEVYFQGQIRYLDCEQEKLYWDGHENWYTYIPYICSIDSPLLEARKHWSCYNYTCTPVQSSPASRQCLNGGTCVYYDQEVNMATAWQCECPEGFHGDHCEQ